MNVDFKQVYVSSVLEQYFGSNFRSRWNLSAYNDSSSPSIFLGIYDDNDVGALLKHKGPKILIWGGADMETHKLNMVSVLQKDTELYTWAYPGDFSSTLSLHNIRHKDIFIPLKDYSSYKPFELGNCIYVYRGIHGNRHEYFKWNEIIGPLIEKFGEDRIVFADHLPTNDLLEKIYKKCFVYVKPTPKGGCTTMFELGHMGVKTIGKGNFRLDIFKEYSDIENLLNLIEQESVFIGKTREILSESLKKSLTGEEWLTLDFWRNNEHSNKSI